MTTPVTATHSDTKPPKSKASFFNNSSTSTSSPSSRQRRSQPHSQQDDDPKRMKSHNSSSLLVLQEMFPLWNDEDLLTVLAESGEDPNVAAEKIYDGRAQKWGEVKKKTKERSKKHEHEAAFTQEKHHHTKDTRSSTAKHFPRGPKSDRPAPNHSAPRTQKAPQKPHFNGPPPAVNSSTTDNEPAINTAQALAEPTTSSSVPSASSTARSWADMASAPVKPVLVPIQSLPSTSPPTHDSADATITVKIPSSTSKETSEPTPASHTSDSSAPAPKIPTGPASVSIPAAPVVPAAPAKQSWADIAAPPPPAPKPVQKPPATESAHTESSEFAQPDKIEHQADAPSALEEEAIVAESVEIAEVEVPAQSVAESAEDFSTAENTTTQAEESFAAPTEPVASAHTSIPTGPASTTQLNTLSASDANVSVPPGLEKATSTNVSDVPVDSINSVSGGLTSAPISSVPTGPNSLAPSSGPISQSGPNDTQRPISLPSQPAASAHAGYGRRIDQDSPVVLPGSYGNTNTVSSNAANNNNRAVNRVGAQFGSLNLSEDESSQDKNEISAPTQPRATALEQQQQQQPTQNFYSQQPQQSHTQQNYNNYGKFNQRYNNQYQQQQQQQQTPAQQPQAQQAGQTQGQQQIPHKPFDNYNQNQFMYPGSHPAYGGYSYGDYSYPTNEAPRNNFAGYYNPYPQQHPQEPLNRGLNQYEQPSVPQQTSRYNADKTPISATATANPVTQSPASNNANPSLASGTSPAAAAGTANQYGNLPYFVNPYYSYPYFVSNNYANQKPYYGQQNYYGAAGTGVDYRNQQAGGPQLGGQQQQQSVQQPQGAQQGAQPGSQAGGQPQQQGSVGGGQLSGISDFLQREDKGTPGSPQGLVGGASISGQSQLHQPQQQQQQQTQQQQQQQPQYQPNMYSYAGYGNYGAGRQNWNYN